MTLQDYQARVNAYLAASIQVPEGEKGALADAMQYSLMAGGKRIRPVLALEFSRMLGGDMEATLPIACAIEMLHTYSLIHDDLPCMDNDDLRRGKPTNHVVYGECTATLAGDALQSLAFSVLLSAPVEAERKVRCASILAEAAGYQGMCYGQHLDMLGEGRTLSAEELTEINNHKTGALLSASCMLGASAAGATQAQLDASAQFGPLLGLAFQIRDDMLDVLSSDAQLGKPVGSDAEEHKNTYMALYGAEKCAKEIRALTERAISILQANFSDTVFLTELARSLETRNH